MAVGDILADAGGSVPSWVAPATATASNYYVLANNGGVPTWTLAGSVGTKTVLTVSAGHLPCWAFLTPPPYLYLNPAIDANSYGMFIDSYWNDTSTYATHCTATFAPPGAPVGSATYAAGQSPALIWRFVSPMLAAQTIYAQTWQGMEFHASSPDNGLSSQPPRLKCWLVLLNADGTVNGNIGSASSPPFILIDTGGPGIWTVSGQFGYPANALTITYGMRLSIEVGFYATDWTLTSFTTVLLADCRLHLTPALIWG